MKAALLRGKYADIILNAQKKVQTVDHESAEEIERRHKQEKARLEAEAKAAAEVRRRKEAEAAAEARKRLEEQREAMRRELQTMSKSVELDESQLVLKEMHLLSAPAERASAAIGRSTHTPFGGEGARGGGGLLPAMGPPPPGLNVLEHLGLSLRDDDESDGDDDDSDVERGSDRGPASSVDREGDVEDGEI
eukprot:TRINITY_DN3520_c0_g3_i1.p1 TRINITY_DN3520_c0_g3~~TRINITY_DN3520_c0_g3_i1.p1  ORF type:complete len:214 (-),score=11.33 TRINITY_DN3520_c0_g3_i1:512-1087(-)